MNTLKGMLFFGIIPFFMISCNQGIHNELNQSDENNDTILTNSIYLVYYNDSDLKKYMSDFKSVDFEDTIHQKIVLDEDFVKQFDSFLVSFLKTAKPNYYRSVESNFSNQIDTVYYWDYDGNTISYVLKEEQILVKSANITNIEILDKQFKKIIFDKSNHSLPVLYYDTLDTFNVRFSKSKNNRQQILVANYYD